MKKNLILSCLALAAGAMTSVANADSLIDGVYHSPSGDNGRGACALTITSLSEETKYGDQLFQLESSGEGACEWSAIGLSKNFSITAGSVTGGGVPTFVKLTFPFGPAGKRIQLTAYDADGSIRHEEQFMQTDNTVYTSE